jgi:hypothetical protein
MLDDRFEKSEKVCQQKSGVSDSAKFFQKKMVFIQTQNIVAESQLEKCGLKYEIYTFGKLNYKKAEPWTILHCLRLGSLLYPDFGDEFYCMDGITNGNRDHIRICFSILHKYESTSGITRVQSCSLR